MAETKADLIKQAKALGIEHVNANNTMAELREEIAKAAPKKHDKEALPVSDHKAEFAKAGKRSAKAVAEKEEALSKTNEDESTVSPSKTTIKPTRTRLERAGKKMKEAAKLIDRSKEYTLKEALELATKTSTTKFDSTLELHIRLNVDPRQADQNLRDNLMLPEGTGKTIRVAVFAEPDDAKAAKEAGADIAGDEELLAQLEKGIINFDILIATPKVMAKLGKYARVLGPKGLMPNPKSGTVTPTPAKAVAEAKAGRVEYRVDSTGIIHVGAGKISFGAARLEKNAAAILASIKSNKPSSIKGIYVKSIYLTTTMGPSIKVLNSEL